MKNVLYHNPKATSAPPRAGTTGKSLGSQGQIGFSHWTACDPVLGSLKLEDDTILNLKYEETNLICNEIAAWKKNVLFCLMGRQKRFCVVQLSYVLFGWPKGKTFCAEGKKRLLCFLSRYQHVFAQCTCLLERHEEKLCARIALFWLTGRDTTCICVCNLFARPTRTSGVKNRRFVLPNARAKVFLCLEELLAPKG